MPMSVDTWTLAGAMALFVAAAICAILNVVLRPLLARYALARPNARSSHRVVTPQGGGIAVIAAMIFAVLCAFVLFPDALNASVGWLPVLAATVGLAAVGVTDDILPLDVMPRLILQAAAIILTLAALPADLRIVPVSPWWLERALMLIAGVWFVNLVNFMDGIDWMTVAEVVPVTAGLAIFGMMGLLPPDATIVAIALCGAMLGFAPFNKPVARLFLGDVGSLPIGLILGWLLVLLAGNGHLVAALLLPLYYLADTTITLARRIAKGERFTQAHRSHFYQRGFDGGYSVYKIVGRVFAVNVALAALALVTLVNNSWAAQAAAFGAGCGLVAALLWSFERAHTSR
jgi:UDP-N-acetylmuramyl pentapeptide phosphotransferase/UDP-N-acetylglucosamine-1-phosphate transferase